MEPQGFTDDQRKAMLEGVRRREGEWENMNMESELEKIGKEAGLGKDDTSRLLKKLIDKHYIDPGRALQAGNRIEGKSRRPRAKV